MDEALRRYILGEIPGHLALMQLFIASDTEFSAREKLLSAFDSADSECTRRLKQLKTLWDSAPDGYSLVSRIHGMANCESGRGSVRGFRNVFDRAAGISAEAGVALYSLGNRELLESITTEVVAFMRQYHLFNCDSVVAEIGCGAGRFLRAMAPCVRRMIGLDISQAMLRHAQEQLHRAGNVLIVQTAGTDLSMLRESAFDLMLAIDSFPYIVDAGLEEQHFHGCARALAPGGRLLVMNFAYGASLGAQRQSVARLAGFAGLNLLRNGMRDLRSWDGTTFLLQKPAT